MPLDIRIAAAAKQQVLHAYDLLGDKCEALSRILKTVPNLCPLIKPDWNILGADKVEIDDELFVLRLRETKPKILSWRAEQDEEFDRLFHYTSRPSCREMTASFRKIESDMEYSWIEFGFFEVGGESYKYAWNATEYFRNEIWSWAVRFSSDIKDTSYPTSRKEVEALRELVGQHFVAQHQLNSDYRRWNERQTVEKARIIRDMPAAFQAGHWLGEYSFHSISAPPKPSKIGKLVEQFKYAAEEFRGIRQQSNTKMPEVAFRKVMEMNILVELAIGNGHLPFAKELSPSQLPGNLRGHFVFNELVGYDRIESDEQFPDEYYLRPGCLSKYSSVFQPIHVGNESNIDTENSQEIMDENSFEILGYYSHACDLIARLLESECKVAPVDFALTPPVIDTNQETVQSDPLDEARKWIALPSRNGGPSGRQRDFVRLLIESDGHSAHTDINITGDFLWQNIRKGARNIASRINKKLEANAESWRIDPEDKCGCTIVSDKQYNP